jgi:hypothetical protein
MVLPSTVMELGPVKEANPPIFSIFRVQAGGAGVGVGICIGVGMGNV